MACTAVPANDCRSIGANSAVRPRHRAAVPQWDPICCKQAMQVLVRRAILRSDGSVVFCAVWQCDCCGRLLL